MLKAVVLFFVWRKFYDEFFFARTIFKTRFVCEDGSAMCFASGPIFGNKFWTPVGMKNFISNFWELMFVT